MAKKRYKRTFKKHQSPQPGLPPGARIFIGEQKIEHPKITLIQYNESQFLEKQSLGGIPIAESGNFLNWYDVKGLHDVMLVDQLGKQHQVHGLVLEDILDTQQRPKFEEYDNGIFITLQALTFDREAQEIHVEHIAIYAGPNFVLSFQEKDDDTFAPVRERLRNSSGRIRQRQSDYLAYALADSVVDHYFIILDQIQEVIESLEEEILYNPNNWSKSKIHQLKLQMLALRKAVMPLREAVNWFAKSECVIVQQSTEVFTRDLYDHIVQVIDIVETYRDILNGLYDLYLSEISYRTNNVMRVLTIISTIFMPLTFIVGVYGMNFEFMPELKWRYGYYFVWGFMVVMVITMLIFFRRKKWL
ncbi:MAG: magnesium/cobalt transporter CorA [Saprospiraceae bacterium]